MHRWTLRFTPAAMERAFLAETLDADVRVIRILAGVIGVISLCGTCARIVVAGLADSIGIFVSPLLATLWFLSGTGWMRRNCRQACFAMIVLLSLVTAALPTVVPPELRQVMVGLVYVELLAIALVPIGIRAKAFAAWLTVGAYLVTTAVLEVHGPTVLVIHATHLALGLGTTLVLSRVNERARRQQWSAQRQAEAAGRASDGLLNSVLPPSVAARLRENGGASHVVDDVTDAVVLFADIVGFTPWAKVRSAKDVARTLDDLFSRFDDVCAAYGVEKIKTIGDAYMAVAGIPLACPDPARRVAEAALALREALDEYRRETGVELEIRIGLNGGRVAAGIIGRYRFVYDLWGDTVNVAARLEATAGPGEIHVSADLAGRLRGDYAFVARGRVELKGIGPVETYLLTGRAVPRGAAA